MHILKSLTTLLCFCCLSTLQLNAQGLPVKKINGPLAPAPNTCYERTQQSFAAEICDETGEWVAVICRNKATHRLVFNVYEALAERGHARVDKSLTMNEDLKQSLTKFQQTHHLPVGGLNLQTLELLNIDYQ